LLFSFWLRVAFVRCFWRKKCEEMAWSVKNFYLFPQTYYFSSKLLPPISLLKHRIGHVRAFMHDHQLITLHMPIFPNFLLICDFMSTYPL
jgi:hypothetical protein